MIYDYYIGIDPGENGGIVVLGLDYRDTLLTKMPDNYKAVLAFVRLAGNFSTGCIELVHSMPNQGVSSSFKFGKSFGACEMVLNAHCAEPPMVVPPQKWQKALGIAVRGKAEKKTEFKQRLRATAQKMFPRLGGITLQTCDALLIAVYCKRLHEGTL